MRRRKKKKQWTTNNDFLLNNSLFCCCFPYFLLPTLCLSIAERLNVLYEQNWTMLVHEQLRRFEGSIIKATKGGFTEAMGERLPRWSFTEALLYSLTLITTIGRPIIIIFFNNNQNKTKKCFIFTQKQKRKYKFNNIRKCTVCPLPIANCHLEHRTHGYIQTINCNWIVCVYVCTHRAFFLLRFQKQMQKRCLLCLQFAYLWIVFAYLGISDLFKLSGHFPSYWILLIASFTCRYFLLRSFFFANNV